MSGTVSPKLVHSCTEICSNIVNVSGDGDTRHIGYKIAVPGAFEIASVSILRFS